MINAQPRFAIDDSGELYCYATAKSIPAVGTLTDEAGTWDLSLVKALILAGKSIETAFSLAAPAPAPPVGMPFPGTPVDKVAQADQDFLDHPA